MSTKERRGRKPRGGISSLDDLLATPAVPTVPSVPVTSFSVYEELPWSSSAVSSASSSGAVANATMVTAPHDYTDEQIDAMDMFPNDDYIDYETLFRTHTTSGIHRGGNERYQPMAADAVDFQHQGLPEHMRILRLPAALTNTTGAVVLPPPPPPTQTDDVVPQFHHAFRIQGLSKATICSDPCVLEDSATWPQSSPFACWWCAHTFSSYPKVVPTSIHGKTVQVTGNFCSWNCAKAYAVKRFRSLALFNTMYRGLFGENSTMVSSAPSPLCLKTFGGTLSIDEYRKSFQCPDRKITVDSLTHMNVLVAKCFVRDNGAQVL